MAAPGRRSELSGARSNEGARALAEDLEQLVALQVDVLVSLLPTPELARLGIEALPDRAAALGLDCWRHAIVDGSVPRDVVAFARLVEDILSALFDGRRVVAHCHAGLGRSGVLGAALALRSGVCADVDDAVTLVRSVRSPHAVERPQQFAFLADYLRLLARGPTPFAAFEVVHDRRRAAVLGLAVGDALGVPAEFMSADDITRTFGRIDALIGGGPFRFAPGETTDDTALAIATAAAYGGEEPELDLRRAADQMLAWFAADPKDIGGQTKRAIQAMVRGVDPSRAGEVASVGGASAGNGSLMRCLATGLLRFPDDPRLVDESIAASRLTHDDPRCVAACVAYNVVLSTLLFGVGDVDAGLERATRLVSVLDAETCAVVEGVRSRSAPRVPGTSIGYVLYCLERALIAARDGVDLRATLVQIVHEGGDTDTNAAVAGALLGAKLGLHAVPADWRADLVEPPGLAAVPWLQVLWRGESLLTAD